MPRRLYWLELKLYRSELQAIARAAGVRIYADHTGEGWEASDIDVLERFVRDAAVARAREGEDSE